MCQPRQQNSKHCSIFAVCENQVETPKDQVQDFIFDTPAVGDYLGNAFF
jgi:hypothetical protein